MSQVGLGKQALIGQFCRELRLRFLDFFSRELGGVNSSWNFRVKIPSYHITSRNRRHNPERNPANRRCDDPVVRDTDTRCRTLPWEQQQSKRAEPITRD